MNEAEPGNTALHPWRFGEQAVVLPHDLNFYPPHPWLMEILPSGGPYLKSGPASLEESHTGDTSVVHSV